MIRGEAQPCRLCRICINSSTLKRVNRISIHCVGKIGPCNAPGVRATTSVPGARITTQTPPTPALRLCIIKPTGFSGLFRECNPCFSGHCRFFPLKKANLLNDALVERRSWRGLYRRGHHRVHRRPHTPKNPPGPSPGSPCPCAPAPFFPPASTQFWMVAKGTNTRWSRQSVQLALR